MRSSEALKETAVRLYCNLHTGATENIVSSLLTASLNSSDDFMKWFCGEAGLTDTRRGHGFYAEANGRIPRIMKKPRNREHMPDRPDVFIARNDEEDYWERIDDKDEKTAEEAARSVHAIFVEVKHTVLSESDKTKYTNFLDRLSLFKHGLASEGKLNKKHKFVIVSSLTDKACGKLKRKNLQKATTSEKQWRELTIGGEHPVKHLTLQRIYDELHEHRDDWCRECTILEVFKYYLALHLWVIRDDVFMKYWSDLRDDYGKDIYGLKWEIADSIRRMAEMALVKIAGSRHGLDYGRIRQLEGIEFGSVGSGYRLRFIYLRRNTKSLTIHLPDAQPEDSKLQLETIVRQGETRKIKITLEQVSEFVQNTASQLN